MRVDNLRFIFAAIKAPHSTRLNAQLGVPLVSVPFALSIDLLAVSESATQCVALM